MASSHFRAIAALVLLPACGEAGGAFLGQTSVSGPAGGQSLVGHAGAPNGIGGDAGGQSTAHGGAGNVATQGVGGDASGQGGGEASTGAGGAAQACSFLTCPATVIPKAGPAGWGGPVEGAGIAYSPFGTYEPPHEFARASGIWAPVPLVAWLATPSDTWRSAGLQYFNLKTGFSQEWFVVACDATDETPLAVTGFSGSPEVLLAGAHAGGGFVDRWDGHLWTRVIDVLTTAGRDGAVRALAGSSHSDVWAVGDGFVRHLTGCSVEAVRDGDPALYDAAWSSGPGEIWATANLTNSSGGSVVHFHDGGADSFPSAAPLHGIWGASSTDIWAVGEFGSILHYDGVTWSPVAAPIPPGTMLTGVSGSSASDVWAVGTGPGKHAAGIVLHWDGLGWSHATQIEKSDYVAQDWPGVSAAPDGSVQLISNSMWVQLTMK